MSKRHMDTDRQNIRTTTIILKQPASFSWLQNYKDHNELYQQKQYKHIPYAQWEQQ